MRQFEGPRLATDCIVADEAGNLVLIRRRNEPFKGSYALPGGFVEAGETIEDACRREVKEETNLEIYDMRLLCIPAQAGIPEDTLSLSRLGRELTLRS
jgi:ADP-ribose pyrophosphatase YjhB (NUDIX family)